MNLTRKEFLKLIGAGAAVLVLGGFSPLLDQKKGMSNNNKNLLPKAQAQTGGSWAFAFNTPIPAIHVTLLKTGKVLYGIGSGWNYNRQPPQGPFDARVRDMNTGAENILTQSEDIFCAGQCELADGTILFAGGTLLYDTNVDNCNGNYHGLNATYEFDPDSETFNKVQNMAHGRWYPTLIPMDDGRVWCYNGYDEYGVNNRLVERYDPTTKTWTLVPGTGTLTYQVGEGYPDCPGEHPTYQNAGPATSFYPRSHYMPSGLIVTAGFRPEVRSWNPANGAWGSLGNTGATRHYGTSFLLPLQNTTSERGRIMVCGGSSGADTEAVTSVRIIDFNAGTTPAIRTIASNQFARKYMSPVILPTGLCVVFGGTLQGNRNPVLAPEAFDPVSETWQTWPASTIARYYHSTAILLPDGKVWIAGGTRISSTFEERSEFFSPFYINETRPMISGTPTVGAYDGIITIPTPNASAITQVSLLKLMNTTHHYDSNQRLIWLPITSRGASSVLVRAPINARLAPAGYYLLFVLQDGIPSTGTIVKIPGTAAPPTDTTAPVLAITSPPNNSTHPPGTVTVSGTVTDDVSVRDVRVRVDSNAYQTATTTNNWANWTINLNITATGTHSITANARDNAGRFTTRGITINIGTAPTPDSTLPNVAITSPSQGASFEAGAPITVSGTASDNVGVRDVRVRVDSGGYLTATTTNAWANWTINLSITAAGVHRITANARDAAGNFRTTGRDITIGSSTPDTTSPSVAITSPEAGATVISPISVSGTASDTGGSGLRDVRVRIDSGAYQTATGTANWSTSIASPSGNHRITVNARDNAGNFRTTGRDVLVILVT